MGFIKEFKEFAMRGNVMDMAVGIIIGGAFGKIVSSLVEDVIMPPVGMMVGGVDFTKLVFRLSDVAGPDVPQVVIRYGKFLQTVFDFTIVAFAIFMMVKGINSLKRMAEKPEEGAAPPPPPADVVLLTEIRDLLKTR